jgi:hypothetical protein
MVGELWAWRCKRVVGQVLRPCGTGNVLVLSKQKGVVFSGQRARMYVELCRSLQHMLVVGGACIVADLS